jgi:hypothetical protein
VVPLSTDGEYRIGRGPECHIRLRDPALSRLHCGLQVSTVGTVTVVNFSTTVGTRIGGATITSPEPVAFGTPVLLGAAGGHAARPTARLASGLAAAPRSRFLFVRPAPAGSAIGRRTPASPEPAFATSGVSTFTTTSPVHKARLRPGQCASASTELG